MPFVPWQARAAFREGQKAELQAALEWPVELQTASAYTPAADAYPPRRRATRFSYAIWAVISPEGEELQPVLEAEGASERLRLALLRMRDLAGRLESD